ncbi:MAG: DUF4160 domain-containing protein [Thermoguttaceae bacterium]
MPEISSFYGIRVTMNHHDYGPHNASHFHVQYQKHHASFSIATGKLLAGGLPRRQMRLVLAWYEIHREELAKEWSLAINGLPLFNIPPLK